MGYTTCNLCKTNRNRAHSSLLELGSMTAIVHYVFFPLISHLTSYTQLTDSADDLRKPETVTASIFYIMEDILSA